MSGSIITRHGHTIDDGGRIQYQDEPSTFEDGDHLAGHRIDRRRCYAIIDGELCVLVQWSAACSGCSEDYFASRGWGCSECGYTGRRRRGSYVPYFPAVEEL